MRGPYEPDRIRVEEMGDFVKASGNEICDECGCAYKAHQPVPGYTWLRKLCCGTLVKCQ